jgi:uncharacterized protein (DUF2062 family)/2-polyprenyl-3-methyl-5-hydroxy-6-metoxy-1,4-benzoquinol methylase
LTGTPTTLREKLRLLWRRLRGGELSRGRASGSIAAGLFIGCLPLYGLHFPLCLAVCLPLRLDVVVAYLAANISNPLFAPFLLTAEVEIGARILTGSSLAFDVERARRTGVSGFVAPAAIGSLVLGSALASCGAALAWLVTARRTVSDPLEAAIRRTVTRYRAAPPSDRFYVAGKLRSDPLVREIVALDGCFGSVLDAGCGRGQFGLLLQELGRVDELVGFDWDERKVRVARVAGRGKARFERADLTEVEWPAADTVLLIDVLHYLPLADQDRLLARAAQALRPGGRILVREVDARPGLRARLTMLAERIGAKVGYNRAGALEFRTGAEIAARLRELELTVDVGPAAPGSPLGNVLMVARRTLTTP